MDTKSFVNHLNQITEVLLTMVPAQRKVVHQSTQSEITVNELFLPIFDNLPNDQSIIAIASDQPISITLPKLNINDIQQIKAFVLEHLDSKR